MTIRISARHRLLPMLPHNQNIFNAIAYNYLTHTHSNELIKLCGVRVKWFIVICMNQPIEQTAAATAATTTTTTAAAPAAVA